MIEWIVTSSVMICIVMLLRGLLRRRISPGVRYSLWLLVLIRLLLPVSFIDSSVSVMNFLEQGDRAGSDASRVSLPPQALQWKTQQTDQNALHADDMNGGLKVALNQHPKGNESERKYLAAPGIIWLAGAVLSAIFILAANFLFRRRLLRERKQLSCEYGGLKVYQSSLVTVPCLFGLLSPAVYVPAGILPGDSRFRYIVLHENTHFYQGDHVWALLRTVCLCVHWFNPLVWLAVKLSRIDAELCCDRGTIRQLNEEDRLKYGEAVISLCVSRTSFRENFACMTSMSTGKWQLKERLRMIVQGPVSAVWAVGVAVLVCVCGVCITYTGRKAVQTDNTENRTDYMISSEGQLKEDSEKEALTEGAEKETPDMGEAVAGPDNENLGTDDTEATLFGYNGYTGYLDECASWTEKAVFEGCDYDGDGLTDRVYRTEGEDGYECGYRIDFGNGESFDFPGKWVSGGYPSVLAKDLTGEGVNEIIFIQSYGFSTNPMAFGELAVLTRGQSAWQAAELPFTQVDGDYAVGLTLHYEKEDDRKLRITCKEAALDETVELDKNLWEDTGYQNLYPGQSFGHPVWDVTIEQGASGPAELVCRMKVFDKWCGDEVVVKVVWSGAKFELTDLEYVKSLY